MQKRPGTLSAIDCVLTHRLGEDSHLKTIYLLILLLPGAIPMPLITVLLGLFKVWMLVDALQRGCGRGGCGGMYWYWLILMPFGDFAYFFVVKIHDPEFVKLRKDIFTRPPSVEQLRYNMQHNPCYANKKSLAMALLNGQNYTEALSLFDEILKQDAADKNCLYGKAF